MKLSQQRKVAFIVISLVSVGVIVIASLKAPQIKNQLNAWKLLPQPEKLTELYYANSTQLPTTYTPNQPQSFKFTTHNLEYQDLTYHYSVTAQADGSQTTTPISTGSFNLNQNQSTTTPITVTLPDLGPRVKVTVTLTTTNESIDYWVVRKGA